MTYSCWIRAVLKITDTIWISLLYMRIHLVNFLHWKTTCLRWKILKVHWYTHLYITYIFVCINIAQNMCVIYISRICIMYMYICKRIVKLICHRRSNMLSVSQCCDWESNHNSVKFLFFSFSFSAFDPHRECFRLFLDLYILKFCFRHTINIIRKERAIQFPV